ncbi:MAG: hypothetical protein KBC36_12865 [Spirochaetia bacterium]|nr:hypothetical protein [Spirochaetia bacterium]
MKKAFALVLALVAVAAFAQTPSVSADATLTWGYDLDTDVHGFKNAYTADVTIPFAVADAEATGEGTYGYISLSGITFELFNDPTTGAATLGFNDTDADGYPATLEAKIISGPFYMMVYNFTELGFNKAADLKDGDVDLSALIDANLAGTELGFSNDTLSLGLVINSKGDWTTNAQNEYAIGLNATFVAIADLLKINAGFAYDMLDASKGMGAYVTLPVTLADVVNGLTITPAFDLNLTSGAAALYDARVDVSLKLTEKDAKSAQSNVGLVVYYSDSDDDLELKVSFSEAEVGGFVPYLAASGAFEMYNLINGAAADWKASWSLSYKAMLDDTYYVKPYASGTLNSADLVTLTVGVDAFVIANTVFTAKYVSGDLTSTDAVVTNDKGDITFAAKITL